jgi:rare lipoprotein A
MKPTLLAVACASLACVTFRPPAEPLPIDYFEEGRALVAGSRSSDEGDGAAKLAASREWDPGMITGSHRSLPVGTCVMVTNLENGFDAKVHIVDRGAFTPGVIIELSTQAARKLGVMDRHGSTRVRLTSCE